MAKIEDVDNTSLLFSEQGAAPTTPSTGDWRFYFKSDGAYVVDDAGSETGPLGAGGGGSSPIDTFEPDGAVVGSSPPSTGIEMKAGSAVVTLSSNEATISFPTAFTNGVISIVASNGDTAANATGIVYGAESTSTSSFIVRCSVASGAFRVNYVAIGW